MWRYATSDVHLRMVLADLFGGVPYFAIDLVFFPTHLPFAFAVAAVSVGLLLTLSSRFVYQFARRRPDMFAAARLPASQKNKISVAIVGAGEWGVLLASEPLMNRNSRYHPAFFIDNDRRKIGTRIEGIPVIGPDTEVMGDIGKLPVQEIIIALPGTEAMKREQVFDQYMKTRCKVMIYDYPTNRMEAEHHQQKRQIREINIEDLLFRDAVALDAPTIRDYYHGKRILVTGAGGSIGSEIYRRLDWFEPEKDIAIKEIGLRPVWEVYEELLFTAETFRKTDDDRISVERTPPLPQEELNHMLRTLRQALDMRAEDALMKELKMRIVPSYRSAREINTNTTHTVEFQPAGICVDELLEFLWNSFSITT